MLVLRNKIQELSTFGLKRRSGKASPKKTLSIPNSPHRKRRVNLPYSPSMSKKILKHLSSYQSMIPEAIVQVKNKIEDKLVNL